jgi:tetratricopeptide (TPR) repeat protein
MLSPAAASMFRLLGLHPGPDITQAAAASLAGLPASQARPQLAELARAHLVTQHAPGRYAFHDLLRAYASELARTRGLAAAGEQALHRVLDHYLHTARHADQLLHPNRPPISLAEPQPGVTAEHLGSHAEAMAWFAAEHQVLLAAIRCAAGAGFDTHTWQLAWAITTFLHRQGHWQDAAAVQGAALDAARRLGEGPAQGHTHRICARTCARLGRHREAHDHLRQAIEQFTRTGDQVGLGFTHINIGIVYEYQGLYEHALACALRALDVFTAARHAPGRATALNSLGWTYALLGNHDQGRVYSEQALALFQEIGNLDGAAHALDNLGYAHHHLGHPGQAISLYQQAIAFRQEVGDRYYEALTLANLGDAYQATDSRSDARLCWRQALSILDELDHPDASQLSERLQRTS